MSHLKSLMSTSWFSCRLVHKLPFIYTKTWPLHERSSSCVCRRWLHFYSKAKSSFVTPLHLAMESFGDRIAVVDRHRTHTYNDIRHNAYILGLKILDIFNAKPDAVLLNEEKIALLCPNDVSYITGALATWLTGGVVVPLCISHPPPEWQYFLEDSNCKLVLCTEEFVDSVTPILNKLKIPLLVLDKSTMTSMEALASDLSGANSDMKLRMSNIKNHTWQLRNRHKFKRKPSLIIYTSGTTGRPKGVVHTHGSIQNQVEGMCQAWEWSQSDVVLHTLPLHHVHGVINGLMVPLYAGATCVMLPHFVAKEVWDHLLTMKQPRSVNMFMGVPTMYAKLLENFDSRFPRGRGRKRAMEYVKAVCSSKIRLMISGSAALPTPVLSRWEELTGHRLLERYGMTETGMVLTNPLHGSRVPGAVGMPFPNVEVLIARQNMYSENGYDVICRANSRRAVQVPDMEEEIGELYVKGANMFQEYLNRPEATRESYTPDGWFKTGDTAMLDNGVFRILGRTSVDIIKSGGYKISALDVERHLLGHADITDVAVVGLPDITWGQQLAAVVVLRDNKSLSIDTLRTWAKSVMPSYQIPSVLKVVDTMPRNAMGKVNKKELLNTLFIKEMKHTL